MTTYIIAVIILFITYFEFKFVEQKNNLPDY